MDEEAKDESRGEPSIVPEQSGAESGAGDADQRASAELAATATDSGVGGTPAGWYPDANAPGTERYWNGQEWTDESRSGSTSTVRKSDTERKAVLAQQIQMAIAQGGRVESQSEFQAVIVTGQPVNNTLHAIVTILTCLIWGIVWIILSVTGGERRQLIVVDEFGNATVQRLGKR